MQFPHLPKMSANIFLRSMHKITNSMHDNFLHNDKQLHEYEYEYVHSFYP